MKLTPPLVDHCRRQFPALSRRVGERSAVFFDGPGGTQAPQRVIEAVSHYLAQSNANGGGLFATSRDSDRCDRETGRIGDVCDREAQGGGVASVARGAQLRCRRACLLTKPVRVDDPVVTVSAFWNTPHRTQVNPCPHHCLANPHGYAILRAKGV